MKKSAPVGKLEVVNIDPVDGQHKAEPGFKSYDASTFCTYTATGLVARFQELHGVDALLEAEYYLELAINSADQCQIETWNYVISALEN